jgi:GMP synthase (glutamine-hydrolysing)
MHRPVLVLDFGSQYVQLIARRVREAGTFAQIVRHDISLERIKEINPLAIILSGGPASVHEGDTPRCDPRLFESGYPILGICYGMQLICNAMGGTVAAHDKREYGHARVEQHPFAKDADIFAYCPSEFQAWMSHGDQVTFPGNGFAKLASTADCEYAAVAYRTKPIWGVQFHPEVSHTTYGKSIFAKFLDIVGSGRNWTVDNIIAERIQQVRTQVDEDEKVICGLSGGVDSAVCAALLHKALGSRVKCVFVDNGLLRTGERSQVQEVFGNWSDSSLTVIDASDEFLDELRGVVDPQEKRKIIGRVFIDVFKRAASCYRNARFLAQGTLYPDVIESGGSPDGPAAVIKLHHNVGGLPKELGLELIEPLRDLFKDEARVLGLELGLPEKLVCRHPFPGPGLAVRCLGEVTRERLEVLRKADAIFLEELEREDWMAKTSQTFAVLLPTKSVGVMGDGRTYDEVLALRSVITDDFMTATAAPIPHDLLGKISTRIINEVRGVNRVVYDITSKPPATIEWE